VRAFQARQGLTPDGVVGPRTEAALVRAGASLPPGSGTPPRPGPAPAPTAGPHPEVSTQLAREGPGYYGYRLDEHRYGIPETVEALRRIAARWQAAHPGGPRLGIGDISKRGGGPLRGHASHQLGVDVDIRIVRNDGTEGPTTYQADTYSRPLTQELVNLIRANGVLRVRYVFFNDRRVMDVTPWPNHDDHLHVRFYPPASGGRRESDGEVAATPDRRGRAYACWLQDALNRVMGSRLAVDGVIGPRTRAAIRAFQARKGLVVDGVVGPRTEAALVAAGAPPPGRLITPPPQPQPQPSPARVVCQPSGLRPPEMTVIALTSRLETGRPFGCVVSATDGISLGMLQWNLLAGTLQRLLGRFDSGGRLSAIFGTEADRLRDLMRLPAPDAVEVATRERLATRWREPFQRLCADPEFCRLMMNDVVSRLRQAQVAARALGLLSTRGLAMLFDVQVGDGLSPRKRAAFDAQIRLRQGALGNPLTEREKLVEIANTAPRFVKPSLREERRARRLLIANGRGRYRRGEWDLDREFPTLDERWE
jgi:peptidoglycan hydrolase-like protein with peptidoglycan-binding domain